MIFENHNQAVQYILNDILENGKKSSPRGMETLELLNYHFSIKDTNSILDISKRKLNYAFSIIEKLSFVSGKEDPILLMKYNKELFHFYNKKENRFDGDYAPRIYKQIPHIINELFNNPDSRRAIITIRNNLIDTYNTKDHPCTLSMQFLIRDDTLHMITTMRSNDAYLSTTGYDIINFTFLLNFIATHLNITKTMYHHNVGSLHIYKQHIEKSKKILPEKYITNNINFEISNNWHVNDLFISLGLIKKFWKEEENIRLMGDFQETSSIILNQYLSYIKNWWNKKDKYNKKRLQSMLEFLNKFDIFPIQNESDDETFYKIVLKTFKEFKLNQ